VGHVDSLESQKKKKKQMDEACDVLGAELSTFYKEDNQREFSWILCSHMLSSLIVFDFKAVKRYFKT
jgi:hypothetical protein